MISGVSLEGWINVARAKRTPAIIQAIPLQRDKSFWDIADTSLHRAAQQLALCMPLRGTAGGTRLAHKTDKTQSENKADLTVRIQPSACTHCWALSAFRNLLTSGLSPRMPIQ